MKTIYSISSLFFFIFLLGRVQAQCPEGDVTFIYQQDVDHFLIAYPDCAHITGNLNIGEFGNVNTTVSDISGLNSIMAIDGNLNISNTLLTNLQGLQNLTSLEGRLFVHENNDLTTLEQLSNLTETGGLEIYSNEQLLSLTGLENISGVYGNLRLGYNQSLQNVSLTNMELVSGYLEIINNLSLVSLSELNSLTFIGSNVWIGQNSQLVNLEGLESLTTVDGTFVRVFQNPQLVSLQGIENLNLETFEGSGFGLIVNNNGSLTGCNLPNVCNYLSLDPVNYPREIMGNTGNCVDENAVLEACNLGISDMENLNENWQVYYQKQTNSLIVKTEGFQLSGIQIYTSGGQLLKELKGLSSNQEQFQLISPNSILIIKAISKEGKTFAKKVIIKN